MEEILQYLQSFAEQNIQFAPYLIFTLLLLAGLNIPVSEDGMLFISALLARQHEDYLTALFIGVFLGAYGSDLICFFLGRFLGPKLFKIKWFSKMVSEKNLKKVESFYQKYGIFTLLFGRFVPFGVRNALFLTAGFGGMNVTKFALSDLLACTISCTVYFSLYYHFGKEMISVIQKSNMVIFGLFLIVLLFAFFRFKNSKQEST